MYIFTKNTLPPNGCATCQFFKCIQREIRLLGPVPRLVFKDSNGFCSLIENGRYSRTIFQKCRYSGAQCLYKRWVEMPPNL